MPQTSQRTSDALAHDATLRALYELAVTASGVRDPAAVARLALEHACRLLDADGGVVFGFDVATGLLRPVTQTDSPIAEPSIAPGEGAVGQAFQRNQPVRIDDYQAWEHAIGESASRGMASGLAVPLATDRGPEGAVGLWTLKPRVFSDGDVQLLGLIAAQLAPALQAARLTEEAELRAERFKALHEVAVAGAGVLEPAALAKLATERLRRLLHADGAGVWWQDAESQGLEEIASTASRRARPRRYAVGEGAVGLAFQRRRPVLVDDYPGWREALRVPLQAGVASIAAIPLTSGDRPAGSLAVWTYARRHFDPEDIQLMALFAAQVAPAIEAAHLSHEAEERARTFETLHELSVAAGGVLDPSGLAALVVEKGARLLDCDGGALFWWEADAGVLRVLYESDPEEFAPEELDPNVGAAGVAFRTRKSVVVDDYASWEHAYAPALEAGVRAVAAVPLLVGDRALGALILRSKRPAAFAEDGSRLMGLLAAQVAPALEAARLLRQREAQADAFRILHELAVTAGGVLEPAALARQALEHARQLTASDEASLAWWDEDEGVLAAVGDTQLAWRPANAPAPGKGAIGDAYAERRPVVVNDYPGWEHAHPMALREGVRATLAVPLLVGDRALGALSVRRLLPAPYLEQDVQLMLLLAAQVAPALHAARLVEEREVQAKALVALQDLAVAVSGLLQPEELATLAVERARALFHCDRVALYWWDDESAHLLQLAHSGPRWSVRVKPGHGSTGRAFSTLETVRVDDYAAWEHSTALSRRSGYQGALAVPLLVHDRAVGAITMASREKRRFSDEEGSLLRLLASQVAPALEAARLHANLVRSEQHIRSLYETLACGVLVQGAEGVVLDANRAAEEMLGVGLRQMRGRRSEELWEAAGESGERLEPRPALIALQTRQPVRNFTVRIGRRDGTVRWLQADSIPVLDRSGLAAQVVTSLIDVTERRRAEAALRESEERFRAVFDNSAIGIARLSREGHVIETNPALCAMLGYEPWELIGTPLTAVIHPEDYNASTFREVIEGGNGPTKVEIRCLRKDGSLMWGSATASSVHDEKGNALFVIGMVEDISDRRAQAAALEHQALHDALTGLPNRSLLHDRLLQAIRLAQRESVSMALMMMDLDRFKDVNDTFGHHSGDLLLREVAGRLTAELRASDTVARLGGDEFAIVMMGVESENAASAAARKLLRALEPHFELEGERFDVGASIGIALFPAHGEDADTLMRRADVAMYVAKRAGSGYAVYAPEADRHTPDRLALSGDLRQAIADGELLVHYQPQVAVSTLQVVGVEALVRWPHPRHGLLLPDAFIPLAEHTGLVRPLGVWVLAEAIGQCRRWLDRGLRLRVSVNLSVRNLHDPLLPDTLVTLLERHEVPPELLEIEMTESTLMADPEHARRVCTDLAAMGIQLAIDDFGTGYSSLAHLRSLPVSEIKIDKSFVMDAPQVENDAVIVRSTIDLGHNLGLKVVAEGVADRQAWELISEGGCDFAQGELLGLPCAPAEIERQLLKLEKPVQV